jgi:hypothetical protein
MPVYASDLQPFTNIEIKEIPTVSGGDAQNYGELFLRQVKSINIGEGTLCFRADKSGIWLGAKLFADAIFSVSMAGAVTASSLTLIGGIFKYGKTSFTDSTHDGYYISNEGLYFGSAGDVTKYKFIIATGEQDYVGNVSGRATSILASAIDSVGHFADANFNTSAKTVLADFNFGSVDYAGALKTGDITWNVTTGVITGGSGVAAYRKGIVAANDGVLTFSLSAVDGSAYFLGEVCGTAGYFGNATNGVSITSTGLLIVGTGIIGTGATGARLVIMKTLSGGYTHGLELYNATVMVARLQSSGSPTFNLWGTGSYGCAAFLNESSTCDQDTHQLSAKGLQNALYIITDGSAARSGKAGLLIQHNSAYGYAVYTKIGANATEAPFRVEANSQKGANIWEFKDDDRTGTHPARITNEYYLEFPAYYHYSEFDENIASDTVLASTVIANAFWTGSGAGTQTLMVGSVRDVNSYIAISTGSTGSQTSQIIFGRYIGFNQPTIEIRFLVNNLTNAVYRLGFYYDATHYCYFEFDSAVDASKLYLNTNNGSGSASVDTGITLSANNWYTVRIALHDATHALCWYEDAAKTGATQYVPVTVEKPYIFASNKTADEDKIIYVDYVKVWSGRDDTSAVS